MHDSLPLKLMAKFRQPRDGEHWQVERDQAFVFSFQKKDGRDLSLRECGRSTAVKGTAPIYARWEPRLTVPLVFITASPVLRQLTSLGMLKSTQNAVRSCYSKALLTLAYPLLSMLFLSSKRPQFSLVPQVSPYRTRLSHKCWWQIGTKISA